MFLKTRSEFVHPNICGLEPQFYGGEEKPFAERRRGNVLLWVSGEIVDGNRLPIVVGEGSKGSWHGKEGKQQPNNQHRHLRLHSQS